MSGFRPPTWTQEDWVNEWINRIRNIQTADNSLRFYPPSTCCYNVSTPYSFFSGWTIWQLPPLLSLSRASWDENQNVQFANGSATSNPRRVRVIINNADDSAHSFHLHGSPFYVLACIGAWPCEKFPGKYDHEHRESGELGGGDKPGGWVNHDNPVRRDTVTVPRWGHVLIAFMANNPGLWLLHCHMLVHQGVGMAVGFRLVRAMISTTLKPRIQQQQIHAGFLDSLLAL